MSSSVVAKSNTSAQQSELGKTSSYDSNYNPERLFAIARSEKRQEIGIDENNLPFFGFDCWNHYEVSWLNSKGKPVVATAEIFYDCRSPKIIESKSLKLYFNSFNNTKFSSVEEVEQIIQQDLKNAIGAEVMVKISRLDSAHPLRQQIEFSGECIDFLDIECTAYTVAPAYLTTIDSLVDETLHSNLLKSNCLVTQQPDWGSVQIAYKGNKIDREGLLRYIVSFRNHNEFHEQCIERIFTDIMQRCKPNQLTVYGRYTRRGGLDINPYRSTHEVNRNEINYRLIRQ